MYSTKNGKGITLREIEAALCVFSKGTTTIEELKVCGTCDVMATPLESFGGKK